jgi:hypothetical protein
MGTTTPPKFERLSPGRSFTPRCPNVRQICLAGVLRQHEVALGPGMIRFALGRSGRWRYSIGAYSESE